ncbi:ribosome maturation factor RimM, partial [Streptococcus agalactiae]
MFAAGFSFIFKNIGVSMEYFN